jgi:hypothetical protein
MQLNDMAEKKRVLIDGVEIPGLVDVGEILIEKGLIEVPEYHRIRQIQNGIKKIPVVTAVYKIQRGTPTLKFFRDWFFKDEDHDVIVIRTDALGTEFARTLLPNCESVKYYEPPFTGASPVFAQIQVTWVPWDVIPLDAK